MILGAILLFIAAAVFMAAELFLPSHGVLAIGAAGCAVASVVTAYMKSPMLGLIFGVAVVLMVPVVIYWAVRLYPKTPVGKRVMLEASSSAAGFEQETEQLSQLVGKRGNAMTMLRPAGTVELDGQRIDAVSEAEIIYPGTAVEIIRVDGMKVIVKAV
ncbi:MAG: hypothetical protein FWD61_17220 [Phycisphaerales bacterium]|nr:hypothetical protein [Phycisphaerales bacterium]